MMDQKSVDGINGPLVRGPQIDLAFASELEVEDLNGETLQSLAMDIGIEGALKLVNLLGGSRFYIPRNPSEDHPIWLLGEGIASTLTKMFAVERIDIPQQALSDETLSRLILARLKAGQTIRRIALELNVGYRTVERVGVNTLTDRERRRLRRDSDAHLTGVADYAR